MSSYNGIMVENVLTDEECDFLISYSETHPLWNDWIDDNDYWNNRVIFYQLVEKSKDEDSIKVKNLLNDIRWRINDAIVLNYNIPSRVFTDGIGIVRWPDGLDLTPHADNLNNDGTSNGLDWRDFGTIIYLNDNFEGGETYYPEYNIHVKPKKGALAVHPGGLDHLHGVTKVIGNTRYTIASFWSLNSDHWDGVE